MNPAYDEIDRQVHQRACELLGGEEKCRRIADQEHQEVMALWNQNTELIGRILRAHLFVEQFMVLHIRHSNPSWKPSSGFARKIGLLDAADPEVAAIIPGIRKLNAIRNRLAHEVNVSLASEDVADFFDCRSFYLLLRWQGKVGTLKPIEVLEDFSRFAAIALSRKRSRLVAAVMQATIEMG